MTRFRKGSGAGTDLGEQQAAQTLQTDEAFDDNDPHAGESGSSVRENAKTLEHSSKAARSVCMKALRMRGLWSEI